MESISKNEKMITKLSFNSKTKPMGLNQISKQSINEHSESNQPTKSKQEGSLEDTDKNSALEPQNTIDRQRTIIELGTNDINTISAEHDKELDTTEAHKKETLKPALSSKYDDVCNGANVVDEVDSSRDRSVRDQQEKT